MQMWMMFSFFFFFQAEDGIRDLVRSRGLGDVYKRQAACFAQLTSSGIRNIMPSYIRNASQHFLIAQKLLRQNLRAERLGCLLYTSDAADERSSVDLGGRRIIKKKKNIAIGDSRHVTESAR